MSNNREKKRFPFYGLIPYIPAKEYLQSDDMQYSSTEQSFDGTFWDIVECLNGEYFYTNLEEDRKSVV